MVNTPNTLRIYGNKPFYTISSISTYEHTITKIRTIVHLYGQIIKNVICERESYGVNPQSAKAQIKSKWGVTYRTKAERNDDGMFVDVRVCEVKVIRMKVAEGKRP